MRLFTLSVFILILFLQIATKVEAIVDPLSVPNNKYGIHIVDENDLIDAAKLVNSSGGDWGYVTMVVTDDDKNIDNWQKKLDLIRSLHLIPIIRLATHPVGDTWEKPKVEDAQAWTEFLSNLYWVSKNRYIIIFNEPNHASEWGGDISPSEYTQILTAFSQSLKKASPDFFILPAGLDASAPRGNSTMDEVEFIREMILTQPDVFSYIDGWTSHSYPNPGFRGSVSDSGRGTLMTYLWELEILKSFGQNFNFPVFITETGWPHMEGIPTNRNYYNADYLKGLINEAAQTVWTDTQVVAITPFILNYQAYPFANFSWRKVNEESFYPYYDTYKALPKISGKPLLNSAFGNFSGLKLQNLALNYATGFTQIFPRLFFSFWRSFFSPLFKL